MGKLLGGGDAAKKAQEKALAESRIANDRSLAEMRSQEQSAGVSRRNPRGRRLFTTDDKTTIA